MSRSKAALPSLDGIRGIGALLVVVLHADWYFGSFLGSGSLIYQLTRTDLHLEIIVDTFFILSGFVMSHVYGGRLFQREQSFGEFYLARIARICPLYLATVAAVALIAPYSYAPPGVDLGLVGLLKQFTFTGFLHGGLAWNYPSWSVQVEMYCYLLYPLLALAVARYSRGWTVLLGLLLCATVLVLISNAGGDLYIVVGRRSIVRGVAGFAAGILLYEAWRRGWVDEHRRVFIALAFGCLLAFLVFWQDALLVVAQGCLVVLCLDARSPLFATLNAARSRRLGDISYSIYLWHVVVQFAIAAMIIESGIGFALNSTLGTVTCVALTLLSTVVIAHWSYEYIEKPGRTGIRSLYQAASRGLVVTREHAVQRSVGLPQRSKATTTVTRPRTRLMPISLRMRSMEAMAVARSVVRRKRA
jgi:peptidoglycan/LPS O-acetylase OafA/YrhL